MPKSDWDFSILARNNETFPKYARGHGFAAYLAGKSDAASVLRVEDPEGLALSFGLRPLTNGSAQLETVHTATVTAKDTRADYSAAWGDGGRVSYEVGLNGVKEAVTFDKRPEAKGDLIVSSVVTFDQDALTPRVNGTNLTGYAHLRGDVVFVNASGAERFRIPQAFVRDAGGSGGAAPKTLWLEYQLDRRGDSLLVSAVVPEKFLNDSSVRWPITVDPTISSPFSGTESYTDCDIYMESSLLLLEYSSLSLTRCFLYFNGTYALTVSPTATLSLTDSTILSNSPSHDYEFYMNGNLQMTGSSILDTSDGIQIVSTETVSIESSLIANSAGDGIALLAQPASFLVNGTTIQNVNASALKFEIWGSASALVNNSLIFDAQTGVELSQSILGLAANNLSLTNITGSAIKLDHSTASFEGLKATNASKVFEATGSSTLYAGNSTALYATTGTSCADSTTYLDQVSIFRIAGTGYDGTNCAAYWTDGNYYAWSRSLSSTSVEVRHRLNILLLNATGFPLGITSLAFYESSGSSGAPTAPTASSGWLNGTILREFSLSSAADYTFYTPHRIDVVVSGTPSVHYYVGGKRAITIHTGGDADADGIKDTWEDVPANATWIEAEYKMRADDQLYSDLHASGDAAIAASANGTYFTTLGWPILTSGTYQFLMRAAGNGLGASLNLSANDTSGNSVLPVEQHAMTAAYSWVATAAFTIASSKSVVLNATSVVPTNSTFLTSQAVVIDKIAIVRLKDGSGAKVGYGGGQMSDPLDNDTDFDGLADGYESNSARGWYEAEVLAASAPQLQSELASSGVAIQHPTGTGVVLNAALYRLTVTPSSAYQLYVRLRSLTGSTTNASLSLNDGVAVPATSNAAVGLDWVWVAGPTLTTGANAWQINVTVIDLDDPNLNDATGYLAVDEVSALKASTFNGQAGWFNATSPMDGDADRDGLEDGPEVEGLFPADIVQAENYTSASSVTGMPTGIRFDSGGSWSNYTIDIRYAGQYRFLIEPFFEVDENGGTTIPYDTLKDILQAEVRDAGQATVSALSAGLPAFNYSNRSTWEGNWAQVGAFYDGRFNLTVGTYSIKLTINGTKASQLGARHFRISIDYFYVQKYRLNSTLWDVDSDFVADGYEVNRSMLPLRTDSDYDTLPDLEEIHDGSDGFVTSPISNDTDADGILDPVEVRGTGDADTNTGTDPTNADSDRDALPDGWVDGWRWVANESRYRQSWEWRDGLRQPWEGEDLDGNGTVNTGDFPLDGNYTSASGETDPNLLDTDSDTMDDSWEVIARDVYGTIYLLDPTTADAYGDSDQDALVNFAEFRAGTNPFVDDTDSDSLRDDEETRVFFRTSVELGAVNTSGYWDVTTSDWIFFDLNSYDSGGGKVFNFSEALVNESSDSGFAPNRTLWIRMLSDGGLIVYNASENKVAVWDFDSDPYDANADGVLEGTAHIFTRNYQLAVNDSNSPLIDFRGRELVGPVNPTRGDTDNDGLSDGQEGYYNSENYPANWNLDYDGDGYVAAADSDADGDGISDGSEDLNWNGDFEPETGETAMFAADTDYDGIPDAQDPLPLDQDDDGLAGFLEHTGGGWSLDAFLGVEHGSVGQQCSYCNDPDADGDGLLDGIEDANHNGTVETNETDPLDADTDDDGLWDGPLVRNEGGNVSVPVQSHYSGQNISNVTVDGKPAIYLGMPPWYVGEGSASYNLTNLTYAQYVVTANLTETGPNTNLTRTLHVRLNGTTWGETRITLNTSAPNGTELVLGHILRPIWGAYNLSISYDIGGIYLSSIALTPVNLSEAWFGTNPLRSDTDGDWLSDGAEVGLTNNTTTGCYACLATDFAHFQENQHGYWSDPTDRFTDADELADGANWSGGQCRGEWCYGTNPGSIDSDGDSLSDPYEIFTLHSKPLAEDSDNDGLPDSYEPLPTFDPDEDGLTDINDSDSDNNGSDLEHVPYLDDYNSTEPMGGANVGLTAVFRTNVTHGEYWRPGIWVAANVSHVATLDAYRFDQNITDLGGYFSVLFQAHERCEDSCTGNQPWYNQSVRTFEGLRVLYKDEYLAIRVSSTFAYRFRAWTEGDGPLPAVDPRPSLHNATETNYRYRETLNWSAVISLASDLDGDGLSVAQEAAAGTNASDPDTDHDGLNDGLEVRLYHSNGTVNDTDGDGLTDGFEIYNWSGGRWSDPVLVDSDGDGAWDGNFTNASGGMPSTANPAIGEWRNGSDPLDWDSDGDSIPDGWELYYGFNASDPMDAVCDFDYDTADNWQEYYWGQNETDASWDGTNDTWAEPVNGTWWNGTNPLKLDTDNDTMPDGWEMAFGLVPTNNSDKVEDPDQDGVYNYHEYDLSVVITSWNWSRSWDPANSADPLDIDTDGDGMLDDDELLPSSIADWDGDGVPSVVDRDSDADGLPDSVEVGGWEVGVSNVAATRLLLISEDHGGSREFDWRHVSSDPFDPDTDDDGVGDAGEYLNFSDPTQYDTDLDYVPDAADRVWDSTTGDYVSLSTAQDTDPPELSIEQWRWNSIDCWLGGAKYSCANISFVVWDFNGVKDLIFTNLGSRVVQDYADAIFGSRVEADDQGTVLWGWILMPLNGGAQTDGEFQVLAHAEDWVGNVAEGIFFGGKVHQKWKDEVKRVDVSTLEGMRRGTGTGSCPASELLGISGKAAGRLCISSKAWDIGSHYGFDMAAIDGGAGLHDLVSDDSHMNGAAEGGPACDQVCHTNEVLRKAAEVSKWEREHGTPCAGGQGLTGNDLAEWIQYARTLGPSLNPFGPSREDEINLTTDVGTGALWCNANGAEASSWLLWLKGFYNGTKDGSKGYFILTFVASMIPIGAVGKAALGLIQGALKAGVPRAVAITEAVVTKAATKAATKATTEATATRVAAAGTQNTERLVAEVDEVFRAVKSGPVATKVMETAAKDAGIAAKITQEGATAAQTAVKRDLGRILARHPQMFEVTPTQTVEQVAKHEAAAALAAEHGIVENFGRFAERFTASPMKTEKALGELKRLGLDANKAYEFRSPRQLSKWVGESLGSNAAGQEFGIPVESIVKEPGWFPWGGRVVKLEADGFIEDTAVLEMKSRTLGRVLRDFRNVDSRGNIKAGLSLTPEELQAQQYPIVYLEAHGTTVGRYYVRQEVYDSISPVNSPNHGIFLYLTNRGWVPKPLPSYDLDILLDGITR